MSETNAIQAAEAPKLLPAGEITSAAEEIRQARLGLCAGLLNSTLAAAHLPPALAKRLREQFNGRVFESAELQTAIEDGRKLVSELTGGQVVQGPGRLHGMFDTRDQLQAAIDDLLGAPREPGLENVQAARLSGIRELYLILTGDYDLHGGYYPDRVALATTADFTGLVKNALNKIVVEQLGGAGAGRLRLVAEDRDGGALQHASTPSPAPWSGTVGTCRPWPKAPSTPSWRSATARRPPPSTSTAATSR